VGTCATRDDSDVVDFYCTDFGVWSMVFLGYVSSHWAPRLSTGGSTVESEMVAEVALATNDDVPTGRQCRSRGRDLVSDMQFGCGFLMIATLSTPGC